MIRNILLGVIGIGILGGILYNLESKTEFVKETVTVTEEVLPEWAEDQEAVEAAQAVIRHKAFVAELAALEAAWASTTEQYNKEKQDFLAEQERLEKEIGSY